MSLPPPVTAPPPWLSKPPHLNPNQKTPINLTMNSNELFMWDIPADLFTSKSRIEYSVITLTTHQTVPWFSVDKVNNALMALPLSGDNGINKAILRAYANGQHKDVHLTINITAANTDGITQLYKMKVAPPFTGSRRELLALLYTLSQSRRLRSRKIKLHSGVTADGVVEFGITTKLENGGCPDEVHSNDLRYLRNIDNLNLLISELQSLRIIDVRSKPLDPCVSTFPKVTDDEAVIAMLKRGLAATKGVLFEAKVPKNLFVDEEDINLEYMKLDLLLQGVDITSASWVDLEKDTRTILGLWPSTGGPPQTPFQYTLTATDSSGLKAELDIEISLMDLVLSSELTNQFALALDTNFSVFLNDRDAQIRVYDQLNRKFGTVGTPSIIINSIKPGSVVVIFNVFSPQATPDNKADCESVNSYIDSVCVDAAVDAAFANSFLPYSVVNVSFVPLGQCKDVVHPQECVPKRDERKQPSTKPNIVFYVVPVIVVVIVLIIIIVVVVICIKRKKQANHDISKSNGTYIETGVPVVFDEDIKSLNHDEPAVTEPLLEGATPKPPAYPQNGNSETVPLNSAKAEAAEQRYPTPPISEHDDTDR